MAGVPDTGEAHTIRNESHSGIKELVHIFMSKRISLNSFEHCLIMSSQEEEFDSWHTAAAASHTDWSIGTVMHP